MDIIWYGQSCFKLKGKSATAVIDPFDPEFLGLKLPGKELTADVVLSTHEHGDHNNLDAVLGDPVKIYGPGEYEIKGVSIVGIGVFHDDKNGQERGKNTVYHINIDGLNVVHVGDLGHEFTEEQLAEIGQCDILLIPIGGVYTIDAKTATRVIAQLEPGIVIPMHYALPGMKVQLGDLQTFLKEMGLENVQPVSKFSITKDKLPEETEVVILSKS